MIMELTADDTTACSSSTEWTSLFAFGDFSNWTNLNGDAVTKGWSIENGIVHRPSRGGDIITKQHYENFELHFDWKISEAGNSGVKYRTKGALGLEYQILDDAKHKDGKNPTHRVGSLYELVAAPDSKPIHPVGEWNQSRILANGNTIQHWLNGEKIVEFPVNGPEWDKMVADSKFADWPDFGKYRTGKIALQDHGEAIPIAYRNIKIKEL